MTSQTATPIPKVSRYPLESLADYTYRLRLTHDTLNHAYRMGLIDALQRWKWIRELSDMDLDLLKLT